VFTPSQFGLLCAATISRNDRCRGLEGGDIVTATGWLALPTLDFGGYCLTARISLTVKDKLAKGVVSAILRIELVESKGRIAAKQLRKGCHG